MKQHSDYHVTNTSAELTKFDGRARGDDVMENLTVSKLSASQALVMTNKSLTRDKEPVL